MQTLNDDQIKVASKYGIGERVFFVKNNYITNDYVRAIYKDNWGDICYYFGQYFEKFEDLEVVDEKDVFKTKAALLKHLDKTAD